MTAEQFAYWLQGFSEINGRCPTEAEWVVIQDHLKTVFHKVTPVRGPTELVRPQPQPGPDYRDAQRAVPIHDLTRVIC